MFREPGQKDASRTGQPIIENPSKWYLGGAQFLRDISREAADDVVDDYTQEYLAIMAEPADGEAAEWSKDQIEYDAVQQAFNSAIQQCPYATSIGWKGLENDENITEFEQLVTRAGLPSIEHLMAMEYGDDDYSGMLDMQLAPHIATLITPLGWTIGGISLSIDRNYFIAPKDIVARYCTTLPIPLGPDMEESKEPYSDVNDWAKKAESNTKTKGRKISLPAFFVHVSMGRLRNPCRPCHPCRPSGA